MTGTLLFIIYMAWVFYLFSFHPQPRLDCSFPKEGDSLEGENELSLFICKV